MASTGAGRMLSRQHRHAQLRVSAQTLRRFMVLWPIWTGDEPSYATMVAALVPLVQLQHRTSAGLASAYYRVFRQVEGAAGSATPRLASFDISDVVSSLYFTGIRQAQRSLAAGLQAEQVRRQTLTRVSGTVARQALAGGRDTILQSVAADPVAVGWQRVTSGSPCAFCTTLSANGPAYRRQDTAGFEAHDHCSCTAEPAYGRGPEFWNPQNLEHKQAYDRAQSNARVDGELSRGTSNDALNAVRRQLSR